MFYASMISSTSGQERQINQKQISERERDGERRLKENPVLMSIYR